jgi:hypothetical protein
MRERRRDPVYMDMPQARGAYTFRSLFVAFMLRTLCDLHSKDPAILQSAERYFASDPDDPSYPISLDSLSEGLGIPLSCIAKAAEIARGGAFRRMKTLLRGGPMKHRPVKALDGVKSGQGPPFVTDQQVSMAHCQLNPPPPEIAAAKNETGALIWLEPNFL